MTNSTHTYTESDMQAADCPLCNHAPYDPALPCPACHYEIEASDFPDTAEAAVTFPDASSTSQRLPKTRVGFTKALELLGYEFMEQKIGGNAYIRRMMPGTETYDREFYQRHTQYGIVPWGGWVALSSTIEQELQLAIEETFLCVKGTDKPLCWSPADWRKHRTVELSHSQQHPFKDYVESCWQTHKHNLKSIHDIAPDLWNLHDDYSVIGIANVMLNMLYMQLTPYHDLHYMTILAGGQGTGKSTFFKYMLPPDMSESMDMHDSSFRIDEDSNELARRIRGVILAEFSEMMGADKASNRRIKHWLTASKDRYRALYEEHMRCLPRTCVSVGTANPEHGRALVPPDASGYRRYWIVEIDTMHEDCPRDSKGKALSLDFVKTYWHMYRDMLWADAYRRWMAGESTMMQGEMESQAQRMGRKHSGRSEEAYNIIDKGITELLDSKTKQYGDVVSVSDLIVAALNVSRDEATRWAKGSLGKEIRALLQNANWEYSDDRRNRGYVLQDWNPAA